MVYIANRLKKYAYLYPLIYFSGTRATVAGSGEMFPPKLLGAIFFGLDLLELHQLLQGLATEVCDLSPNMGVIVGAVHKVVGFPKGQVWVK